ncbi:MAG: hypothetical protein DME24_06775 [Verrucomicrobia bacterium]|nr:MAG: hypothetical protein DME24_06775 [Verrucomicrobiota bacterium]
MEHEIIAPSTSNIRAVAAEPLGADSWIVLSADDKLMKFHASEPSLSIVATISELGLTTDQPLSVQVSRDGRFVAVTHTFGRNGVVFDRIKRQVTMQLLRGEYYPEHCKFPVAFLEQNSRQLLIHSTDWNRVDVSDPENGALFSQRNPTSFRRGETQPEHYLDYFHCGLAVSPDGEWVTDNGWVWHPVGIVTTWSLRRWLERNVWESEDGESKKSLCRRDYYWDGPLCWIDNRTVAVWGLGDDDLLLIPGVRLFDVESGAEKLSFAGPVAGSTTFSTQVRGKEQTVSQRVGVLAFDRWLFSWIPQGPFFCLGYQRWRARADRPGFRPVKLPPHTQEIPQPITRRRYLHD